MPIDYTLCRDDHLCVTRFLGAVTVDEVQSTYRRIFATVSSWPRVIEITDLSAQDTDGLTASMVGDMAERISGLVTQHGMSGECAIIAPTDAQYGLASIFYGRASFAGRGNISVVRSHSDAAAFVGVSAQKIAGMLSGGSV